MRAYFDKLLNSSQQQKQLPFIFPLLISLMSGAVFSLALAPYYWWWLAILSPALLYACLKGRTPRQAFAIGLSYGFGLWFVGAFWLYTSIHVYGDTNAVLSVLMIAIMAVLAVLNSGQFLAPLYIAPLGGVAAISLVAWLMTFSAKR